VPDSCLLPGIASILGGGNWHKGKVCRTRNLKTQFKPHLSLVRPVTLVVVTSPVGSPVHSFLPSKDIFCPIDQMNLRNNKEYENTL
jgi:hypothetical protein